MKYEPQHIIRSAWKMLKRNKVIFENFSYITLFQILSILFPLITYPYLVRVLGKDLYGLVITAQVLAGYCSIIVTFGFSSISARHISINKGNKEKISEIMSSILCSQAVLWVISFILYMLVVNLVPIYKQHFKLFFFSFFLTFLNILFPQYYFQGTEKMKYITIIQVVFQLLFLALIFVVIKNPGDYIYVPLLHSIGYLIGGITALYIIFIKDGIKFRKPTLAEIKYYTKDALPIFLTDAICTIKDKFNLLLLGGMVNMSQVVVYDVGSKISSIMQKPVSIISTVVFPKMACDCNNKQFKRIAIFLFAIILIIFVVTNIFLRPIVTFLAGNDIPLLPIRLYILSPIFLGVSVFTAQCFFIARGYNKYLLYSIIVTTAVYVISLLIFYFAGKLNNVTAFVCLTVISYFAEMLYRLITASKLMK